MIHNKFNWWFGVIEDRLDPEQLGRVRVRIFGIHSQNTENVPTEDLPWAVVMQPTTSAALSGIGTAPVGLLPGTWCVGFFLDGDEMQQPLVMGTIGGMIEQQTVQRGDRQQENVLKSTDGSTVVDSSGQPILSSPLEEQPSSNPAITSSLPPLSKSQIQKLMDEIGFKESSSVAGGAQFYSKTNTLGYIGKYQMGAAALVTLGYVKSPIGAKVTNSILDDDSAWAGKDSIGSKADFFKSSGVQESIMFQNLKFNYNILKSRGVITTNSPAGRVAGLLAVAHLKGAGGAIQYSNGVDGVDAFGTTASSYFAIGETIGEGSAVIPQPDPGPKYPKTDYIGFKDTNKLAVGITTDTQIEKRIINRVENIPLADSDVDWDEPSPSYGAQYPYNQTIETEAGHLIELDNSPGFERIHIFHKTGAFIEIDVNGSMIKKTIGDNYEIVGNNNNVYVRGAMNLTVDGRTKILVRDNADLEVYGSVNTKVHNNMDLNVAGDLNIVTGGEFNVKAVGNFNVRGQRTAIDGEQVFVDSDVAKELSTSPVDKKTIADTTKPNIPINGYFPNAFYFDSGEEGSEEFRTERLKNSDFIEIVPLESEEDDGSGIPDNTPNILSCEDFKSLSTFPDYLVLSKYFNLGQLSSRSSVIRQPVIDQRGLKKSDIVCNLKNLAVNCLDPIKEKYPNMFVTNAFRKPLGSSAGKSDHEIGCAADLQFANASPKEYFEIAKWIKDNVPFKQLLLEYGGGARNPWIHIALNGEEKHPLPIATFKDHRVYARNKFVNLA